MQIIVQPKRIKNWIKNTMTNDRFKNIQLLNIKRDLSYAKKLQTCKFCNSFSHNQKTIKIVVIQS